MTSPSTTTAASTHHSHEGGPLDSDDDGCTDGEAVGAGVAAVRVGEVGGAVCVGEVRGAVCVGEVRGAVCVGVGATTITDDSVGLGSACAGADVRVGAGGDGDSVSSGVRVRSGTSGDAGVRPGSADAGVRVGSGTVAVGDGNPLAVRVTVGEGKLTPPFPPQEPRNRAASASPAIRTISGNQPALPDPARLATAPPPAFG
ncbi:hypothetical protein AB0L64_37045 [Kribbella sp. NPDC051936]|uniref:hypothetical protein n=1 Tax=Kribbella sp. NPDC051936 TaxID=3154946 RepID=UPI0034436944